MTRRRIVELLRADLLERMRRDSFLVTLGLTVYVAYLLVPPKGAGYAVMDLAGYRGLYNSAWVGTVAAVWTSMFLSLVGFFLVRDAIALDRRTRVGELLAATPLARFSYVFAKWLGNFAYLAAMVVLVASMAGVMQLLRGESTALEPWQLLSPFLFVTLPAMALTASLAVLFETVRFLRGTLGNVLYCLVVWQGLLLAAGVSGGLAEGRIVAGSVDPLGWTAPIAHMLAECQEAIPDCDGLGNVGINPIEEPLQVFVWSGMDWTPAMLCGRLLWLLPALALVALAALLFDRFDPSAERSKAGRSSSGSPLPAVSVEQKSRAALHAAYPPLEHGSTARHPLLGLVREELRLTLRARSHWWLLVGAGLMLAGFIVPLSSGRRFLLGAVFAWGLPAFSSLGCRDALHRTDQLLLSAAGPLRRQLPASWLAGVAVALTLAAGVLARLLLAGEMLAFGAALVAALFAPALALCLGVWSRSRRPFEVAYMLLWYLGPMQGLWALDFLGLTEQGPRHGMPWVFLALTGALLGLAFAGRRFRRSYSA